MCACLSHNPGGRTGYRDPDQNDICDSMRDAMDSPTRSRVILQHAHLMCYTHGLTVLTWRRVQCF